MTFDPIGTCDVCSDRRVRVRAYGGFWLCVDCWLWVLEAASEGYRRVAELMQEAEES